MAGKADMTIHGWRQLIEWSIEHSCMEDHLRAEVKAFWEQSWETFCEAICTSYGHVLVDEQPQALSSKQK